MSYHCCIWGLKLTPASLTHASKNQLLHITLSTYQPVWRVMIIIIFYHFACHGCVWGENRMALLNGCQWRRFFKLSLVRWLYLSTDILCFFEVSYIWSSQWKKCCFTRVIENFAICRPLHMISFFIITFYNTFKSHLQMAHNWIVAKLTGE